MCLGLPLVAWLTEAQRQRVVAKHAVSDQEGESWVTSAMYPCSLLQMHALMQQQQQQQCQAAAPYTAPKVQQMVAGE
jgi:predicted DCC family thiol-disulfide oxidoreductase YuxK